MSFSAVELNYLILRYLEECGLTHTAYLFGRESHLCEQDLAAVEVPNGALVNIVQKGIYFTEYEASIGQEGTSADGEPSSLSLIEAVGSEDAIRARVREKRDTASAAPQQNSKAASPPEDTPGSSWTGGGASQQTQRDRDREARAERTAPANGGVNGGGTGAAPAGGQLPPQRRDRVGLPSSSLSSPSTSSRQPDALNGLHNKKQAAANGLHRMNGSEGSPIKVKTEATPWVSHCEIERAKVRQMTRHKADVFICSWNPACDFIGTGSGDSTARIWDITGPMETSPRSIEERSVVLKHSLPSEETSTGQQPNKDVTTMDWNCAGNRLATGCYDGMARIWSPEGRLQGTLATHKGPIFALKWNELGNYILTAGVDKSTIIWDATTGKTVQQFTFHSQSALDVDWLRPDTFASCSTDTKIHVCRLGSERPLMTFEGHTNEVNAIRYDRHSTRLASCSDDRTLKIWSLEKESAPIMSVSAHAKEIYTIRWSPVGFKLASASFDHTIKVWDVESKSCIHDLTKHTEPVYSVSFSPDGRYLASGSFDHNIYIWDVKSGEVILSYSGAAEAGGIFEVNWSHNGDKLAACTSDGSLLVLDIRQLGVTRPSGFLSRQPGLR